MQDNMTNERFNVIADNMEVSIKDNESEIMEYPFSLACESIADFDSLIQECLEMVGLLNHLHEENEQLKQEVFVYKKAFQQQVQRCTL